MSDSELVSRNLEILEAFRADHSMVEIARLHGISASRVRQIVQRFIRQRRIADARSRKKVGDSMNREELACKILEVARDHANAYRRNVSQFNTAHENETAERCACAASNTGYFMLKALGHTDEEIEAYARSI